MVCIRYEKEKLIKGGYLVGVVGHSGKKVIWLMLDDCFVEEATGHDYMGQFFLEKTSRG